MQQLSHPPILQPLEVKHATKPTSGVNIHLFPGTGVEELKKWTSEDLYAWCLLLASPVPLGPSFLLNSPPDEHRHSHQVLGYLNDI